MENRITNSAITIPGHLWNFRSFLSRSFFVMNSDDNAAKVFGLQTFNCNNSYKCCYWRINLSFLFSGRQLSAEKTFQCRSVCYFNLYIFPGRLIIRPLNSSPSSKADTRLMGIWVSMVISSTKRSPPFNRSTNFCSSGVNSTKSEV